MFHSNDWLAQDVTVVCKQIFASNKYSKKITGDVRPHVSIMIYTVVKFHGSNASALDKCLKFLNS